MSQEKEKAQVRIIFGFQVTHVSEEGELVTETYEPGQEVSIDADLAREEVHRNRVRIIPPEPVVAAEPAAVAEEASEVAPEASEVASEAPSESAPETPAAE